MSLGSVVIFVEFPLLHWHFDPMLNASIMIARVAMRVYMFHGHQFHAPVLSLFFGPYEPYEDITLDDVHPLFHPLMYLTDGESDSNTYLIPTYSMKSDPSEPSYPFVMCLTFDSSSSTASQALPPSHGRGFFHTQVVPVGMAWMCSRRGHGDDALGGFGNRYIPF